MNLLKNYGLIFLSLAGLTANALAIDVPYTLEGADCSMTVHETGYNGDVHYTQFYATVSVSAAPGVLFDVEATSPYVFVGASEAIDETLYIRSRHSHWGPYPMNGAIYQLGSDLCRTMVKKDPQPPRPPRQRP